MLFLSYCPFSIINYISRNARCCCVYIRLTARPICVIIHVPLFEGEWSPWPRVGRWRQPKKLRFHGQGRRSQSRLTFRRTCSSQRRRCRQLCTLPSPVRWSLPCRTQMLHLFSTPSRQKKETSIFKIMANRLSYILLWSQAHIQRETACNDIPIQNEISIYRILLLQELPISPPSILCLGFLDACRVAPVEKERHVYMLFLECMMHIVRWG